MHGKNDTGRLQLNYPCTWLYKVIGMDQQQVRRAILQIVKNRPCEIGISNTSSSGKYICLNLELVVEDEEDRNALYLDLKAHPHVKIVL